MMNLRLIGVEDGDSCGNSRCFSAPKAKRQVHELKTPQASKGTKAKIATSCSNAFVTNLLLA
jgi:hypothetical protein